VHDDDPPTLPSQLHNRGDTLPRMTELIGDRCRLARPGDGVTAEAEDGGWQKSVPS
jgi:hypothetical protein